MDNLHESCSAEHHAVKTDNLHRETSIQNRMNCWKCCMVIKGECRGIEYWLTQSTCKYRFFTMFLKGFQLFSSIISLIFVGSMRAEHACKCMVQLFVPLAFLFFKTHLQCFYHTDFITNGVLRINWWRWSANQKQMPVTRPHHQTTRS